MLTEHETTITMLEGIDGFVEGVGKELLDDFRDLPTFAAKRRRAELVGQLQLFSRVMILERCEALPPAMRTAAVEAMIDRQRSIVHGHNLHREQREAAFGGQGLPDTLDSIGWTAAPEEWGPPPDYLIEQSAQPFVYLFDDFGVIDTVPDLWSEGLTPADMPGDYRAAMRREGYLPPFNEACDTRAEWVAFFLDGGSGAADPAKWQRVFGMVPGWEQ